MKLLVDLGNTRLKWSLAEGGYEAGSVRALEWTAQVGENLMRDWSPLPRPQGVWVASVVDDAREATVEAAVHKRFGQPVQWVRTPREACGVTTSYADPETLGVDRFLGLVAAYGEGHAPCVLVSCGTALVVDALTADGCHLGGLITPGAGLMQQAVLGATARVRPREPGQLVDIATSTADALTSGSWQACAALVDHFIERVQSRLHSEPQVLLGGGGAGVLEPLLEHPVTRYPDAVLKGLAAWADCRP